MPIKSYGSVSGDLETQNRKRKAGLLQSLNTLDVEKAKTGMQLRDLDVKYGNFLQSQNLAIFQTNRDYNLSSRNLNNQLNLARRELDLGFNRNIGELNLQQDRANLDFRFSTALQGLNNQLSLLGIDQNLATADFRIAQAGITNRKFDNLIGAAKGQLGFQNQILDIIGEQKTLVDLSRDLAIAGNYSQEERVRTQERLRTYAYLNAEGVRRGKRASATFFAESGVFDERDLDASSLEFADQMSAISQQREQVAIQREQITVKALQAQKGLEKQEVGVKSRILDLKTKVKNLKLSKRAQEENVKYLKEQKAFLTRKRGLVENVGALRTERLAEFNKLQKKIIDFRRGVEKNFRDLREDKLETRFSFQLAELTNRRNTLLQDAALKFRQTNIGYQIGQTDLNTKLDLIEKKKAEEIKAFKVFEKEKAKLLSDLEKREKARTLAAKDKATATKVEKATANLQPIPDEE